METVVVFASDRGRVLLRRENRGSPGWNAFSVPVEGSPEATARRRVEALGLAAVSPLSGGTVVRVDGGTIHPYRVAVESAVDAPSECEWVHPTEIRCRKTPAGLWRAYRAVSPTVEEVRDDRAHGSAYLSIRALEVLRDRASEGTSWDELRKCALALLDARPSMAAVVNRVNRAMFEAAAECDPADALEETTRKGIDRAVEADRNAAERAAERIGGTVLTLSRSGTVREALVSGSPESIVVLESRPDCEGTDVGRQLAESIDVTVTLDAAVAHVMGEIDHVLVGADTVLADGSVSNKVGTRTAATVAAREGVPVWVVTAADKISPSADPVLETIDRGAITDDEGLGVDCPLFDRTPRELVTGVITENGVLDADGIEAVAGDHSRRARWKEPNGSTG